MMALMEFHRFAILQCDTATVRYIFSDIVRWDESKLEREYDNATQCGIMIIMRHNGAQ